MKPGTIIITGASSGIGAAIARKFGRAPYKIALVARRADKLKELQNEIGQDISFVYPLDVTSKEDVEHTFHKIINDLGPVELLVNNAGGAFGFDKAQNAKIEDWEQCVDVNVNGLLYCTHSILPEMVKSNKGHIINIGSIAGSYAYPNGNAYCGAKAFVHQFSQCLRSDLNGTRVRVTCIEPGLLGGTEFSVVRFKGDQSKADKVYENTKPLLPEDVAEVVYFCHTLPDHVNINSIEMMPVSQAPGPLLINKN